MLASLAIKDIVLIDHLNLEFSKGLSVLTGETGAGKSILLDSLALALGARGDGSLVREGAVKGQVIAEFDLPPFHPSYDFLISHEVFDERDRGDAIILRRVQSADGRTKAYINDQACSVQLLRELGILLVEIHGQHDDRALVDPSSHRILLDAAAGLEGDVEAVSQSYKLWRSAEVELKKLHLRIEEAAREADYLQNSVVELTDLNPQFGEEAQLADLRKKMMDCEKIATELNDAHEVLSGTGSPVPELSSLFRQLSRKAAEVPELLGQPVEHLDQALEALGLAQDALAASLREAEFDPHVLEETESRLFALRAASRKYNVAVENLPDLAKKLSGDLEALNAGEEQLSALKARCADAEKNFMQLANALSDKRVMGASALEKAVMSNLPGLKLEAAEFMVVLEKNQNQANASGIDNVEFWVRTNPGTKAGPMLKVASGGELSRFLLALKVALADRGSAPTLIFDEIDTGVGGAVADAIGAQLSSLANGVQVLSVTHAPQVAARANTHFLIAKKPSQDSEQVVTSVAVIKDDQRREEIARMLAGATITDEARAAAAKLIASV
jgi:DNA repair protein RecN (Recombination protein N)